LGTSIGLLVYKKLNVKKGQKHGAKADPLSLVNSRKICCDAAGRLRLQELPAKITIR